MGKGENAGNQHFSPFPTMFPNQSKTDIIISVRLNLSSAIAFNLIKAIFFFFFWGGGLGKELTLYSIDTRFNTSTAFENIHTVIK